MASPYPVELRERAVAAYQEGKGTLAELAVFFMIGIATLKRWWWRFSKTGSVAPLPHGGGQPARIDTDGEIALKGWVTEQPDLTLDELVEKYQEYFKVEVSQAAMSRTLLRLQLVRKKKSFHATERDAPEVQRERKRYRAKASRFDPRRLVFVDEAGCRIGMTRDYGRGLPGERVEDDRPGSYGGNVTMIGALGLKGMRALMTIGGSTDGDVFEIYVRDVLRPALKRGDIVIMDKLSVHQVSGIRELIEGRGAKLVYLPPYSPDLNPIEECWSKMKSILRSMGARARDALEEAIATAMAMITAKDCRGWFADCGYQA